MEQVLTTYRPGKVSYEKNKITVKTETNSTSILFEDISSLSLSKQSYFKQNNTIIVIGFLIVFLDLILSMTLDKSKGMIFFLLLVGLFLLIWGAFSNKINFENIIIETRGGSKVYFSVVEFKGEHIISSIEDKRREYQVSLSKKEKSSKKEIELENEIDTNITSSDILLQVEKLSKLKDSGILTQEEFDEQKTKLLSKL